MEAVPAREGFTVKRETIEKLPRMTADELTATLKTHYEGVGGLATDSEKAIARA